MSEYQYCELQAIESTADREGDGRAALVFDAGADHADELRQRLLVGQLQGRRGRLDGEVARRGPVPRELGTHVLKLRLPARLLDAKTARLYCAGERASVRGRKGGCNAGFSSLLAMSGLQKDGTLVLQKHSPRVPIA